MTDRRSGTGPLPPTRSTHRRGLPGGHDPPTAPELQAALRSARPAGRLANLWPTPTRDPGLWTPSPPLDHLHEAPLTHAESRTRVTSATAGALGWSPRSQFLTANRARAHSRHRDDRQPPEAPGPGRGRSFDTGVANPEGSGVATTAGTQGTKPSRWPLLTAKVCAHDGVKLVQRNCE